MPTHACFDDALEWLGTQGIARGLLYLEQVRLAHGLCKHPDGGLFAHAWVIEPDGNVLQAAMLEGQRIYYLVTARAFTALWRPVEVTLYTAREASDENYRTGHYGPWVERYKEHCGRNGERVQRLAASGRTRRK